MPKDYGVSLDAPSYIGMVDFFLLRTSTAIIHRQGIKYSYQIIHTDPVVLSTSFRLLVYILWSYNYGVYIPAANFFIKKVTIVAGSMVVS